MFTSVKLSGIRPSEKLNTAFSDHLIEQNLEFLEGNEITLHVGKSQLKKLILEQHYHGDSCELLNKSTLKFG